MITQKPFGKVNGQEVTLYTMTNNSGWSCSVTNYGGILVSINVPDKDGNLGDILLGCSSVEGYIPTNGYVGALIGRVGNRIDSGKATLNGVELTLAKNDGGVNHLHGGNVGFNEKIWNVEPVEEGGYDKLVLTTTSPDGEEGYPGNMDVKVTYAFTNCGKLVIHYEATSDKDTLCNLTNHAYFNLNGEGGNKVTEQIMQINADYFTPVGASLIPTGELRPVDGTPFDLRKGVRIGDRIDDTTDEQIRYGGGYDHNFCCNGEGLREIAKVTDPASGRVMTVQTDLPAVQFYAANMLNTMIGKCGREYGPRDGLCLETQTYPDAINHPNFPTCVLKAGEKYDTKTIYEFSTLAE